MCHVYKFSPITALCVWIYLCRHFLEICIFGERSARAFNSYGGGDVCLCNRHLISLGFEEREDGRKGFVCCCCFKWSSWHGLVSILSFFLVLNSLISWYQNVYWLVRITLVKRMLFLVMSSILPCLHYLLQFVRFTVDMYCKHHTANMQCKYDSDITTPMYCAYV